MLLMKYLQQRLIFVKSEAILLRKYYNIIHKIINQ
jgi:hypothetical protein